MTRRDLCRHCKEGPVSERARFCVRSRRESGACTCARLLPAAASPHRFFEAVYSALRVSSSSSAGCRVPYARLWTADPLFGSPHIHHGRRSLHGRCPYQSARAAWQRPDRRTILHRRCEPPPPPFEAHQFAHRFIPPQDGNRLGRSRRLRGMQETSSLRSASCSTSGGTRWASRSTH